MLDFIVTLTQIDHRSVRVKHVVSRKALIKHFWMVSLWHLFRVEIMKIGVGRKARSKTFWKCCGSVVTRQRILRYSTKKNHQARSSAP